MTPTPAELAAALETVRNTAYGRTYVRRTADGEQRSYLDDCELLARWLAENAGRLLVVRPLEWERIEPWHPSALEMWQTKPSAASYQITLWKSGICEWSMGADFVPATNIDDAKRQCQSDHDSLLAAALAPAFPTKGEQ